MEIKPELLSFQKLLEGRLFRIPEYQRAYSWQARQRQDLFGDIERVHGVPMAAPRSTHFMATIVGLRRDVRLIQTNEFHVIEVVDGQQRITTLVLLLKAIERVLTTGNEDEQSLAADLRKMLVKKDDVSLALLQTNHDSSRYCSTFLREGTHPPATVARNVADHELLNAMEDCEAFVRSWTAGKRSAVDLLALVKNRLQFILHEIADEGLVYTVFEVLNSRGLEVSWMDRLKSQLMGIAFESRSGNEKEIIDELHRIWCDIYQRIGTRHGLDDEALLSAGTLRSILEPGRRLSAEDAVHTLLGAAGGTAKGAIDVSRWLLSVTEAVDRVHRDRRLDGVTDIYQARLLAVAILLRPDFSDAERKRLLRAWEKVSFRIYGMYRKDARVSVGDYVRLAWNCLQSAWGAEDIRSRIETIGLSYPIAGAISALRDANCYEGWQPELRYFLFRHEEYLAAKRGQRFDNEQWNRIWADTPAKSIEHVWSQSKGDQFPTATGVFVHRLGNLTLLPPGLNSKLGAKDPIDKKAEYLRTGLFVAADVADRIPAWDRAAIEKREQELLAWAASEWSD